MNLCYALLDPTKNITALVTSAVSPAGRLSAARQIMQKEPACEQVGFVYSDSSGAPCLSMAGGEFCGNASMSAAALFCAQKGLLPGQTEKVTLQVSGAGRPVSVQVTATDEKRFACTVTMPPPERIAEERLTFRGREYVFPAVYFAGIAHCVLPENALTRAEAEQAARGWCEALGVPGLGLMLFNDNNNTLSPLVYVPAVDTLFWESSCASGTTAVGAYLAGKTGADVDLAVKEPGGTLQIRATDGELLLSGTVTLLAKRETGI